MKLLDQAAVIAAVLASHPEDGACCYEDPSGHAGRVSQCESIAEVIRALPAAPLPAATDEMVERASRELKVQLEKSYQDRIFYGNGFIDVRAILAAAWEAKPDHIEAEYVAAAVAYAEARHAMRGCGCSDYCQHEDDAIAANARFAAARAARGK